MIPDIQNLKVDFGRFYNAEDLQLRGRVCVLGSEAKEKLFSGRFPLGEKIRINGIPYEVIGVLKPRPQEGNENTYQPRCLHSLFDPERLPRHTLLVDMIWLDFLGYDYKAVKRSVRNTLASGPQFSSRR